MRNNSDSIAVGLTGSLPEFMFDSVLDAARLVSGAARWQFI
jgi:hypothetical protein